MPGKKVAAAGAMAAVLAYLVVSGAPPPAERAAITAGVAFLAVLLDRRALTLHSLAIAALVVLALQPEAVAQPGFQMSFAATAALLALVEAWPRPSREISVPWPILAGPAPAHLAGRGLHDQLRRRPGHRALRHPALQPRHPVGPARQPRHRGAELAASSAGPGGRRGGWSCSGWGAGPLSLAHWGLEATDRRSPASSPACPRR